MSRHSRVLGLGGAGGRNDDQGRQLHLISNQPKNKQHSQVDQAPLAQVACVSGHEPVMLHPADAAKRGIQRGDIVRVFKSRGACLCAAVLSDHIRPGVIQISTGAWFDPDEKSGVCLGGNPNVLIRRHPYL